MGSPVSPLVANMFMEHLERKLLDTAAEDLKLKLWKKYVDNILEIVKKGSVEELTEFLNELDNSHNIKFTYEVEQEAVRFAVKQDRKWWLEATDLQETYPH